MALVQIPVKHEEMQEWLPETYKMFIDDLRNSKSVYANKPESKIQFTISWGFFGKKSKSEEEYIQKLEAKTKLTYQDRLNEDLPKIKITVYMSAGPNYVRIDRSIDNTIPKVIIDMTTEVLQITMLKEQEVFNDPVVKESLAEFQHLLDEIKELDAQGNPIPKKEKPLDMDEILDKIGEHGIASLSVKEKTFLDKMSRA